MSSLEPIPDRRNEPVEAGSDDEADPELLELLRQHLGLGGKQDKAAPPETKVLEGAQYIFDNAIDVALSPSQTKEAAELIWRLMQKKAYSTQTWSEHDLHPKTKDESTVDFIFTMDLLNFSFWSEEDESKRFSIEYRGKKWTGYRSLVAALQRALDEGISPTFIFKGMARLTMLNADIPITTPDFWVNETECTEELLKHVFRSATDEEIPLFQERVQCLREAGEVLCNVCTSPFSVLHFPLLMRAFLTGIWRQFCKLHRQRRLLCCRSCQPHRGEFCLFPRRDRVQWAKGAAVQAGSNPRRRPLGLFQRRRLWRIP